MAKFEPYLALDSAGRRTILCDYPIKMFDNTIKLRSNKVPSSDTAFRDRCERNARQVRRKHGLATDTAAMDDETIEKLKAFLQSKLSSEDHAAACAMMVGGEAPDDVEGNPAMDGLDDFYARFPDAARIRIDNSGIQPRARAASHLDAAGAKSFYEMFPDAARIKLA